MSYTDKMQDAAQNFAKSVNPDFVRALGGDGGGGGDLSDLFSLYVAHDLDNDTYIPNCTLSDFLTAYLKGKGIIGTIGEYTIIYVTVTEIESNQCAFFYTLSPFTQSLVNPSITTMYVDMYTWSTDGFAFTAESSVSLTPGQ